MTKTTFKLGDLTIDAQAYGSQGNAILGIRDSGKTYTATEIAEKLFEAGIPFIAFDPTGVWRWLRVPGKGRGYPIVVAGGKSGDLPLTVAGAVEIVRAAMNNGVSLVLDLTDPNLSKADWRRIVKACVRVLLQENAPHGLRHVFIEEAAEFVPQRVLEGDVYAEVEKLARIGGNSRLGYTLINQRSQEVNKAVLELCENLFLHRQKGKNAIQSLDHWLDVAGVDPKELIKSLPRLPSGQCWAWMGDRDAPQLIGVPPKNSFHPDRRTMHGAKGKRARKAVNVGAFVKGMKSALVNLEAEAKASDPKLLQAEITKLKGENAALAKAKGATDPGALAKARQDSDFDGYKRGKIEGYAAGISDARNEVAPLIDTIGKLELMLPEFRKTLTRFDNWSARAAKNPPKVAAAPRHAPAASPLSLVRSPAITPRPPAQPSGDLTPMQQGILDAIAWVESLGEHEASRMMVAFLADSSPKSSTFEKYVSQLRSGGLITSPRSGVYALTDEGRARADQPSAAPTHDDMMQRVSQKLTPGQLAILRAAVAEYPNGVDRDALATQAGSSPTSSTYEKYVSQLKSLGLLDVPERRVLRASDRLFPERRAA